MDPIDFKHNSLLLFEMSHNLVRQKLPRDWCGWHFRGQPSQLFKGHDRFNDQRAWIEWYHGPDYYHDLDALQDTYQELRQAGYQRPYVSVILTAVQPDWQHLATEEQVVTFWGRLIHAPRCYRVQAALHAYRRKLLAGDGHSQVPIPQEARDRGQMLLELQGPHLHPRQQMRNVGRYYSLLRELPLEQKQHVLALVLLGRRDVDDWTTAHQYIQQHFTDDELALGQLRRFPGMLQYLAHGLRTT